MTMGLYGDDCGEGAEGAGEPHVGEILGAGEPRRADATWREERGRSISSAPFRWNGLFRSAPFRSVKYSENECRLFGMKL